MSAFVPATVATIGGPLPPYTDPKNPYYQPLIDNPGLVNTSFPVQQGSNDSQIQQNRQGRSVYQYYNNVNTNVPGRPYVPNTQFKSHAERLAYIQGQIAAGRQGRPFYSFLGTGQ